MYESVLFSSPQYVIDILALHITVNSRYLELSRDQQICSRHQEFDLSSIRDIDISRFDCTLTIFDFRLEGRESLKSKLASNGIRDFYSVLLHSVLAFHFAF